MSDLGRLLMLGGLALLACGAVLWLLGRAGFRGLPGDLKYEGEHVEIHVPLATCLVLSVLATALVWLVQWLKRRG